MMDAGDLSISWGDSRLNDQGVVDTTVSGESTPLPNNLNQQPTWTARTVIVRSQMLFCGKSLGDLIGCSAKKASTKTKTKSPTQKASENRTRAGGSLVIKYRETDGPIS